MKSALDILKEASQKLNEKIELNVKKSENSEEVFVSKVKFDFEEVKKFSEEVSNDIVNDIAMFYISKNVIESLDLLNTQIKSDAFFLSHLLTQFKMGEFAQSKALEEIQMGDTTSKMITSFSNIQKTQNENIKNCIEFIGELMEKYKKLKIEIESGVFNTSSNKLLDVSNSENSTFTESNGFIEVRDQRSFIKKIRLELDGEISENNKDNKEDE